MKAGNEQIRFKFFQAEGIGVEGNPKILAGMEYFDVKRERTGETAGQLEEAGEGLRKI